MGNGTRLQGTGASRGVAVGPAWVVRRAEGAIRRDLAEQAVEAEVERLRQAVARAREEARQLKEKLAGSADGQAAAILDAHLLMLEDPELVGKAETYVRERRWNAEWAMERAGEEAAQALEALGDEYLKARAADIRDVASRVVRALQGQAADPLAGATQPVVVVSDELMPSQTAQLDRTRVLGFVMERGSPTSHAAILARSMGIPAVVGVRGVLEAVRSGQMVAVDGESGVVVVNPTPDEERRFQQQQAAVKARRARLAELARLPAVTRDGHRVQMGANIGSPDDLEPALAYGAEGVGLFRTEFLFLNRDEPPSEEEQFEVYRQVAQGMAGRPVIVRTLDVGGDKPMRWMEPTAEANPFLGVRGIRLSLAHPEVFLVQLKALLRARAYGDVWVMFPMVADLAEVRQARELLSRAAGELEAQGQPVQRMPVGIMVEVPSAALLAETLFEEVDFASIGTNDLTQYVLAADRTHPGVAALADPLHPAVLHLVERVAQAARRRGKWVGVCGDLAGEALAAPLLVGLGVHELSMVASLIPEVKEAVRSISLSDAQQLAREALRCRSAAQVRALLSGHASLYSGQKQEE